MVRDDDPAQDATVEADSQVAPTVRTQAYEAGPRERASLAGYDVRDVIGAGGMGEVVLAHQQRIGRDVAVKRMHGAADEVSSARFLREARVQARLEHPAIVPVYDIGEDAAGQPFFAMKRVAGTTFADVMRKEPGHHRLLRAFAEVCLAIEFAHSRGVVHRDIKPANIVLGDFGEIYVLDWGLARVVGDREQSAAGDDIASLDGVTLAGATLGTPGYMAPEQVHDASAVGPAADIYALGAILFELLARESLHPRGLPALTSTVAGIDGSPAHRRPELAIAPELDALCASALAMDPAARPSARVLAERVQEYIDGDRDVARRRELAAGHLDSARAALGTGEPAKRAEAMRAAGRALALDPESQAAAELVTRLMLEPPRELPAELRAEIAATERVAQRRQSAVAVGLFATLAAFIVLAAANGVIGWRLLVSTTAFTLFLMVVTFIEVRRAPSDHEMVIGVFARALLIALISRGFGSLIFVPGVCAVIASSLLSYPQLIDRGRLVLAILIAGWLTPVVLEQVGVLDPTWSVVSGAVMSTSEMFRIQPGPTTWVVIVGHVGLILVSGVLGSALAKGRRDALRATKIQAWHLRQLLPG